MKNRKVVVPKIVSKPKNGFERLVETKEKAKQKKQQKLQAVQQKSSELPTSTKRIVDSDDINKTLLRKRNKKSLFDLESDDENITSNFFVKEVSELVEAPQPNILNLDPLSNKGKHKSAKEAYQDVIRTSKFHKYERAKTKEELVDDIQEIDDKFSSVQKKLMLSDPDQIRNSKFTNDTDYFTMVDSFKGVELLKPTPKVPKPVIKSSGKVSDGEEPAFGSAAQSSEENLSDNENFDNPEIEDYKEKEVDRRLKRMNIDKAESKLKNFNKTLETLKAAQITKTNAHLEESEDEVDFDSESENQDEDEISDEDDEQEQDSENDAEESKDGDVDSESSEQQKYKENLKYTLLKNHKSDFENQVRDANKKNGQRESAFKQNSNTQHRNKRIKS